MTETYDTGEMTRKKCDIEETTQIKEINNIKLTKRHTMTQTTLYIKVLELKYYTYSRGHCRRNRQTRNGKIHT